MLKYDCSKAEEKDIIYRYVYDYIAVVRVLDIILLELNF